MDNRGGGTGPISRSTLSCYVMFSAGERYTSGIKTPGWISLGKKLHVISSLFLDHTDIHCCCPVSQTWVFIADPRLRHKLVPLHDGGHLQSCSPAAESNEGPKLPSSSWGPSQPLPDTSNRRCPHMGKGGEGGDSPPPEGRPLYNNVQTLFYCIPPGTSKKTVARPCVPLPQGRVIRHVHWAGQVACGRPGAVPGSRCFWCEEANGATGALKTKNPSRPCDLTQCCLSGSVQLTSVLARGSQRPQCRPPQPPGAAVDRWPRKASTGLESPKKPREPRGRRPLGSPSAVALLRRKTEYN